MYQQQQQRVFGMRKEPLAVLGLRVSAAAAAASTSKKAEPCQLPAALMYTAPAACTSSTACVSMPLLYSACGKHPGGGGQ
jgi:hypothetical protein